MSRTKKLALPFAPLFPSLDTQTSVGTCTVPTQPPKIFNSTSHPHVLLWIIPLQQRMPQEFSPANAGPFLQRASMGPAVIMCLTYIFSSKTAPSNTPLARGCHKTASVQAAPVEFRATPKWLLLQGKARVTTYTSQTAATAVYRQQAMGVTEGHPTMKA